jgi:hypothetical protein
MSDKILVVTAPDDTTLDGIRILHVDLSEEQRQVVSNAMLQSAIPNAIINYVWNANDPADWLLDKKSKCNIILFNADSSLDLIVGYFASHPQSYYFGTLRDLHLVNDRAIYNTDEVLSLLEKTVKHNE